MGSSEMDTSAKGSKTNALQQEQAPTTSSAAVYPEWAGFQAYSPIPPPGFFHPSMASSPQAHPYMWGAQQFMHPYGTPPPPYVAMYPHGGLYPHSSIPPGSYPFSPYAMPSPNGNAEASRAMLGGMETDKSSEAKERSPLKRSKGSLGSLNMLMGKNNNELGKASGAPANGLDSHSGESASEDSSEGSDANSQNDSQQKKRCRQDSEEAEASQNGSTCCDHQNGVAGPPNTSLNQMIPIMPMSTHGAEGGVTGPATNLNIGMDYWGGPTASPMPLLSGKDERELKRQRRKQSNRESARRSRLRKQAECEELAQQVVVLKDENTTLVSEMRRIREEYERLVAENTSLKDRLGEIPRVREDSRSDRKGQPSSIDDHPGHLESGTQAGQKELA
ncbi:hypothetical protein AAC387_Pa01g3763 [Persea americana]